MGVNKTIESIKPTQYLNNQRYSLPLLKPLHERLCDTKNGWSSENTFALKRKDDMHILYDIKHDLRNINNLLKKQPESKQY